MQHRNIITSLNPDWLVGHVEERADENAAWRLADHSEWVFARIDANRGDREADDPDQFSCPEEGDECLITGEPGQPVVAMMPLVRTFEAQELDRLEIDFDKLLGEMQADIDSKKPAGFKLTPTSEPGW